MPRRPSSVSPCRHLPLLLAALLPCACRSAPKATASHVAPPDSSVTDANTELADSLACPPAVEATRTGGARPGSYRAPGEADRKAARAALQALLGGGSPAVQAFGFEVVQVAEWPGVLLLRERADSRRGGGAYVVRTGSTSNLVVQAPHTFYDEGTLPLACDMFQRAQARALFINTTHRYKSAPETRGGEHPADVAHAEDSMFLAMTEGLLAAIPTVDVIQLHGFQNREAAARAVVSAGERRPGSPLVTRARASFEEVVGPRVMAYPEDTNELGATTNVEGMAVRRSGGRFLHVEMDGDLRRSLRADAALRARALDALAASFR